MPNDKNELTQEEREKVVKWLTEKRAGDAKCPICDNDSWVVGQNLVLQPVFVPGGFIMGAGYPLVPIFCTRCAYLRLHAAMAIGLVQQPVDSKSDDKPEEAKHGA